MPGLESTLAMDWSILTKNSRVAEMQKFSECIRDLIQEFLVIQVYIVETLDVISHVPTS